MSTDPPTMGKYTFTWEHAAHDVYVTGTFDDWRKTVKLEKEGGIFKKTVELPKAKTQYKFVVNGAWCTNETVPKEDDGHGMVNNVLQPEDIVEEPVNAFLSAAPESSTTALAGAVPKESEKPQESAKPKEMEQPRQVEQSKESDKTEVPDRTMPQDSIPGAFPMTPAAETPLTEAQSFNVNPLPATSSLGNPIKLAPGEPVPHPSTLTDNTVHSTVKHDKQPDEEREETVSVAPFPATAGLGNPIQLAPGQKVPDASTLTPHTVQSTVNTDVASYEKADSLPPRLELGLTPTAEREANGGMFGLPPVTGSLIPESSLPMGADAVVEKDTGVTIQSAAPSSSTAVLAGQVPKESRGVSETVVPDTVTESQKEAGVAPEASANSEAVLEKKEVEQELLDKVPEAPVTADDTTATINTLTSELGTAASTVAGAATAGVIAGADLLTSAIHSAKEQAAHAIGLDKSAPASEVATTAKDKAVDAVGLDSSATVTENAYTAKDKTVDAAVTAKDQTAAAANVATENAYVAKEKAVEAANVAKDQTAAAANVAKDQTAAAANVAKDQTAPAANVVKDQTAAAANVATENAYAVKDKVVEAANVVKDQTAAAANFVKDQTAATANAATENVYAAKDKAVEAVGLDKSASVTDNAYLAKDKIARSVGLNGSTTANTAEDVPEIVSKSQKEAHASPEAATNADAVAEKSQFEQELLSQVHKTTDQGESAPAIAVPAIVSDSQREAHVGPEAAANIKAVSEKKAFESELLESIPKTSETGESAPVIAVPAIVSESQKEAHVGPEATANAEAVSEKKAFESELLQEVPKATEAGEPAPVITAATSLVAPGSKNVDVADNVPEVVADSQKEAHRSPEAATNAEAVSEKKAVENELLKEVDKVTSSGEPAPALTTASTSAAPVAPVSFEPLPADFTTPASSSAEPVPSSEAVSPSDESAGLNAPASAPAQPTMQRIEPTTSVDFNGKKSLEQTEPTVTTGVESTTIPTATSSSLDTPPEESRKYSDVSPHGTPGSQSIASGADDKKKKRRSFFGKIKDKLANKS